MARQPWPPDMPSREIPVAPPAVPASLCNAVAGYDWARDTIGESGGTVHRLHAPGRPDLYLKSGSGAVADAICDEFARLRWLGAHIAVPAIEGFVVADEAAWLLMNAIPGRTAYEVLEATPDARHATVAALAHHLRALHAIPLDACPFDSGLAVRMAQARARIDAGEVDTDDFDDAREGWSAEQVWQAITTAPPFMPDTVVTHGDYSLDNILIANGAVAGCIDVGRAGKADRYQDIAILWNCLAEFDPALQDRFLTDYGLTTPDRVKLDLHLCLDELF